MAIRSADAVDSLDAYYAAIERLNLDGLWRIAQQILHPEPRPAMQAHLWRWADVRPHAARPAT